MAEWKHLVEEGATKKGRREMGKAVEEYRGIIILHTLVIRKMSDNIYDESGANASDLPKLTQVHGIDRNRTLLSELSMSC